MSVVAEALESPLQSLERAKLLFLRNEYEAALREFRRVAEVSRGQAPDVWLDAHFGVAECARLVGQVEAAFEVYCVIADRAFRGETPEGRLGLSNTASMVQALAMVLDLSRLSLGVTHDRWLALLDQSRRWAARSALGDAALIKVDYVELLYARCWDTAERTLTRFRELERRLERCDPALQLVDLECLKIEERQYRLESRLGDAEGGDLPPAAPHHTWRGVFQALFEARVLLEDSPRAARAALARVDPADKGKYAALAAVAELLGAVLAEDKQVVEDYRRSTEGAFREASTTMGDLSSPLWAAASFARLQMRRGEDASWALRFLGDAVGNLTWVQDTLRSRGLALSTLREIQSWTSSSPPQPHAGRALPALDDLFQKVWP